MSTANSSSSLPSAPAVAGGGLLDRRLFLKHGALFGLAAVAADVAASDAGERPLWMRVPGAALSNYGQPSSYERDVVRWVAANAAAPGNGISWTPLHRLAGTITPSGLHFERHHNGVPQIDPAQHRLLIHGLVRRPLRFGMPQLYRYPMVSRTCFIECGGNSNSGWHEEPMRAAAGHLHGLVSCSEWTGIPVKILLEESGVLEAAAWAIAEGADAAAMNVSIPVAKLMADGILALFQNGEKLRPENGYPLRLVLPGYEGVLNVKWLRSLQLAAQPVMARNETAKYTELQPDGRVRQFTLVMEAKSVITHPSPGHRLETPGYYQISGLAWSGRGRIVTVEVSADGGRSWAAAELQEPVLSQSFTRFRVPWRWDAQPCVLQSRARDETGYLQPERRSLIEQRGRHGYFHYNGIVSWAVEADGSLHHVYG